MNHVAVGSAVASIGLVLLLVLVGTVTEAIDPPHNVTSITER